MRNASSLLLSALLLFCACEKGPPDLSKPNDPSPSG